MSSRAAARRRLRALDVLERMTRHEMRDEAQRLGQLRAEIAGIGQQVAELEQRMAREARVTSPESAPYVAGFIRALRREITAAETRRTELEREADSLDEVVREKFRQAKVFDHLATQNRQKAAAQRERAEAAARDEMVLMRWPGARGQARG